MGAEAQSPPLFLFSPEGKGVGRAQPPPPPSDPQRLDHKQFECDETD